jgi:CheY-like chemotaxis protein
MKAQKFTLLIVDDDANDRFFMEHAFQKLGLNYRIHGLASGDEAVAYINGEGQYRDRAKFQFPSYIITDLKMFPGDGFTLLQHIKKHPALSIIPVVMMSSSCDLDDIRHAYLLGASSYFTKPQDADSLRDLLRKINDYWTECQVPAVDEEGYALMTNSVGKAGERFTKPTRAAEIKGDTGPSEPPSRDLR